MTDIQIALTIVAVIIAFGFIVAWADRRDPDTVADSRERRASNIRHDQDEWHREERR